MAEKAVNLAEDLRTASFKANAYPESPLQVPTRAKNPTSHSASGVFLSDESRCLRLLRSSLNRQDVTKLTNRTANSLR